MKKSDLDDAAIHRANGNTLWCVIVPVAIGAFFRIDHIRAIFFTNGNIRAFGFTSRAGSAGGGDDFVGHGDSPVGLRI